MGVKPKSLPGSFPRMSSLLTFACLTSTISAKTLPADIKPSYQVMTGNGILGRFLPDEENFFQMDCSNCFPEGKLASMRIRDSSEKCGKHIVGPDTSPKEHKNKSVAIIYCPPCDDYTLKVTAKLVVNQIPKWVDRSFEYKKDACPLNAADQVNAAKLRQETATESFTNINTIISPGENTTNIDTIINSPEKNTTNINTTANANTHISPAETERSGGERMKPMGALVAWAVNLKITSMLSFFNFQ